MKSTKKLLTLEKAYAANCISLEVLLPKTSTGKTVVLKQWF